MKVIVAGSRDITDWRIVKQAMLNSGFKFSEIVSGGAKGVDRVGESIAALGDIDLKIFPADWDLHGKGAGHIRNRQMAEYADALVAVWDGESRGTKNMIDTMKRMGKPVFVVIMNKIN